MQFDVRPLQFRPSRTIPASFALGRFSVRRNQSSLNSRALGRQSLDDIIHRIVGGAQPDQIILFGSVARGDMRTNSDVDLLVIKETKDARALVRHIYRQLRGVRKHRRSHLVVKPDTGSAPSQSPSSATDINAQPRSALAVVKGCRFPTFRRHCRHIARVHSACRDGPEYEHSCDTDPQNSSHKPPSDPFYGLSQGHRSADDTSSISPTRADRVPNINKIRKHYYRVSETHWCYQHTYYVALDRLTMLLFCFKRGPTTKGGLVLSDACHSQLNLPKT